MNAATWKCHLLVSVAIALTACSSGGSDKGSVTVTTTGSAGATGFLTLNLRDAAVHDVAEVWVEFDGVTLMRADDDPVEISFPAPVSVDLLTLTADNTETLLDSAQVPAGAYEQMRLHVNAEHDGVMDSYVITNSGGQEEIRVPSGSQSGLKLIGGVTITANQELSLMIDWDVRMGLVDPPGLPGRLLRPTLRVMDMTAYGKLTGTVAMALVTDGTCTNDLSLDTGNAVYVYDQFDFTLDDPDDLGGAVGPVPVATAAVTQGTAGDYVFEAMLSPGDYTVAFTCQADDDATDTDEDITLVGPMDVTILDGETEAVAF